MKKTMSMYALQMLTLNRDGAQIRSAHSYTDAETFYQVSSDPKRKGVTTILKLPSSCAPRCFPQVLQYLTKRTPLHPFFLRREHDLRRCAQRAMSIGGSGRTAARPGGLPDRFTMGRRKLDAAPLAITHSDPVSPRQIDAVRLKSKLHAA